MKPLGSSGFLFLGTLSSRDRRALFLGMAVMVPALAWLFAVRPYLGALADARDRVTAERELLSRELDLLASEERLRSQVGRARVAARGVEDRLLQAPTAVLAEGELTDFLEGSASRNRVLLQEIRGGELARGEAPPPGLTLVRLHLRGESDLEGILTFLDDIEGNPLLLRVRGLALEPRTALPETNGRDQTAGESVPTGVVEFQLILDGFAAPEEGPGTQGSLPGGVGR